MKKSNFVHLHTHSEYSILDGVPSVAEIVSRAKELGMDSVAITDHGNIFGAVEFTEKAIEEGIKPIIGCEVYVAPKSRFEKNASDESNYHLILLVMNEEGYKNLCKLLSLAYSEGTFRGKPRIDFELLKRYNEGLIVLSSCMQGEIPMLINRNLFTDALEAAKKYHSLLGDRFYLEVQSNKLADQIKVNEGLREISRRTGIPVVATADAHFIKKEDKEIQDIVLCIQTNSTLDDPSRFRIKTDEIYFKTEEEMRKDLFGFEDAIERTLEVADRISFKFDFSRVHLPQMGSEEELERLARDGLKERISFLKSKNMLADDESKYWERLEFELDVIKRLKFHSYFLIVYDFIKEARKRGIPVGPGRGSAPGSLVAYALGITQVDPLRYGLLFERFLNPDRISLPDIDVDVCSQRRGEIISYIIQKYGREKVAHIATFQKRKIKSAIRDVGRVMGVKAQTVDRIAKRFSGEADSEEVDPSIVREFEGEADIEGIIKYSVKLVGKIRHAGVHAAGVVIGDKPLTEYLPMFRSSGKEEIMVSQFDKDSVEKVGLLKLDLLGVDSITQIAKTIALVKKVRGIDVKLEDIPLDDRKTYEFLSSGETWGVFQLEREQTRKLAKRLKIEKFDDIVALNALIRPGAAQHVDEFIKRKKGEAPITYPHPELEDVLKETYGIPLYQEQVMLIAMKLAGFSRGEADELRKVIAKKYKEKMPIYEKKFIEGAVKRGISEELARAVFEPLKDFGSYGFNKSHAVAYSHITYYTAYLCTHYPEEFMSALLSIKMDKIDDVVKYLIRCRKMGITVLPPDINRSEAEFVPEGKGKIRFGLGAIKNVGTNAVEAIIKEREKNGDFADLYDFLRRVDIRKVNKKVVESLIKVGAFDYTGYKRAQLFAVLPKLMEDVQNRRKRKESGQMDIFEEGMGKKIHIEMPEMEEWFEGKFVEYERELLGMALSLNPLQKYRDVLKKMNFDKTSDLGEEQREYTICGIVHFLQVKKVKKDRDAYYATFLLEDEAGFAELVVFSSKYEEFSQRYNPGEPLVFRVRPEVTADEEGESKRGIVLGVYTLEESQNVFYKKAVLKVDGDKAGERECEEIMTFLREYSGPITVFFSVRANDKEIVIKVPEKFGIRYSEELIEKLRDHFGVSLSFYA